MPDFSSGIFSVQRFLKSFEFNRCKIFRASGLSAYLGSNTAKGIGQPNFNCCFEKQKRCWLTFAKTTKMKAWHW